MGDHVTGNLTNEHQKLKGHLVNTNDAHISGNLSPKSKTLRGEVIYGGTKDYNHLYNKPSINGRVLAGDTTIIEDKTYLYEQEQPKDIWLISHNLNKYPAVTIIDSAGTEVIGLIEYIDLNTVRLTFGGAFSGKAFFN